MADGMERGTYVRMLFAVYASMFLIRLAFGITVVTFGVYIVHTGELLYALVVTASPLLELITVVFTPSLIGKYGRKAVLLTGLGLGAVSLYGLALTREVIVLGLVHALHGIAAALILVTTLAIIATFAPPEHRGREMGLFNLSNVFGWIAGFAAGLLLVSAFSDRLEYTFIIAGGLATAGLVFADRMLQIPKAFSGERAVSRVSIMAVLRDLSRPVVLLLNVPWLIIFMLVAALLAFFSRDANSLGLTGDAAYGVIGFGALLVVSQLFWGRLADKHGRNTIMLVGALGFAALMGTIVWAVFVTPAESDVTSTQAFMPMGAADAPTTVPLGATAGNSNVTAITPTSGAAGTNVTITGIGLGEATRVSFGGVPASIMHVENDTMLYAIVPPGAAAGPVAVTIPTPPIVIFNNVTSHWLILTILLFTALAFAPAGLAAIADEAKEGAQGTTMSAYSLTLSLGFILGPPLVATVREQFGGAGMVVFFAAAAFALLGVVLIRFLQRRDDADAHPHA